MASFVYLFIFFSNKYANSFPFLGIMFFDYVKGVGDSLLSFLRKKKGGKKNSLLSLTLSCLGLLNL